ncbi:unnamed protein product [Lathyrus oleraceus]|uniref:Uncharacterized protein n=1 Tax=Pisum sativum TaxID=3888 RepID=A0A9D5A6I8_PEA|nr:cyclin-dependent protein kinase inhibitor SMR2-like [Pisum sativum]KAI5399472.1 hypothetical protein KIW84_064717 [Pisum sativum]
MSTDLHLHHQLPKLRISAVKLDDVDVDADVVSSNQTPEVPVDDIPSSPIAQPETENENDGAVVDGEHENENENDESYRTPTSKESKIPEILNCPPAPKKPKPFVSCKRKLMDEFQFFEVSSNEDMDAFFRSTFPKRPCPCT